MAIERGSASDAGQWRNAGRASNRLSAAMANANDGPVGERW